LEFQGVGGRRVQAEFNGGHITSDGGALLLRELDERLGICHRFARCFEDHRDPDFIEHTVLELVRQRVYGVALGYEDLNDHEDLRRDPLLAVAAGKVDPEGQTRKRARDVGCALAGKSTLNRLELTPERLDPNNRYQKIVHRAEQIEELFVTLFLEGHPEEPDEVVLDFDATDDPLHGEQEGRFFHGYYGDYCYLPLYVFCGDHLLVARLRTSDRDASDGSTEILTWLEGRIRARWPHTRIIARGDSGFARDDFMNACEARENVYYLLGVAKNSRLLQKIGVELVQAKERYEQTGQAARVFTEFLYRTRESWSRSRRVIAKAEYLAKGPNPRFIVTNLPRDYANPQVLYEQHYCGRGDMENRIKEQQMDLFADRTSTNTMRANQLRLWFASLAYVLTSALRRVALKGTRMARATCGTIRLHLFKIGALVKVTVRRIVARLASACPYQDVFHQAYQNLRGLPRRC
jgi:hypothetical protein